MRAQLCNVPMRVQSLRRSRRQWLAWLAMTIVSLPMAGVAADSAAAPARVSTFIEVRTDGVERAERLLRAYAEALHAGDPAARIALLQETDRRERFVLLESAADSQRLLTLEMQEQPRVDSLSALLAAPLDRRTHRDFGPASAAGPSAEHGGSSKQPLYVVAHVDIAGPVSSGPQAALERVATAARGAAGNIDFEVWQQSNRGNHFNVIAEWNARPDFERFASSEAAREFRASVAPVLGSLYDERLYRSLCCAPAAAR